MASSRPMRKSAFVATAQAIGGMEMPSEVRIELVNRLCSLYEQLNEEFDAERFKFLCRVYGCKTCDHVSTGRIESHWTHNRESHPDLVFD